MLRRQPLDLDVDALAAAGDPRHVQAAFAFEQLGDFGRLVDRAVREFAFHGRIEITFSRIASG